MSAEPQPRNVMRKTAFYKSQCGSLDHFADAWSRSPIGPTPAPSGQRSLRKGPLQRNSRKFGTFVNNGEGLRGTGLGGFPQPRPQFPAQFSRNGEGGIRTPERGQPPLRDFQSRPFNRSGTSPGLRLAYRARQTGPIARRHGPPPDLRLAPPPTRAVTRPWPRPATDPPGAGAPPRRPGSAPLPPRRRHRP